MTACDADLRESCGSFIGETDAFAARVVMPSHLAGIGEEYNAMTYRISCSPVNADSHRAKAR